MVATKKDKINGDALGTGRRKSSVARVRVRPGSGKITVNRKSIDEYFFNEQDRAAILSTLSAVEHGDKVDVLVRVNGGGMTGQSGAVDADQHIDFIAVFDGAERAEDRCTVLFVEEVLVDRLTIDSDLPTAGTNTYASDARLAAPGTQRVAVDLVFLCCNHQNLPGEIAT